MKIAGEIYESQVEQTLEELQSSEYMHEPNYVVLIYGQGGQTRKFYKELINSADVDVLWSGWCGPKWSKIFSFIPGQAGLVRLNNLKVVKDIFTSVGAMSLCSLIFTHEGKAEELRKQLVNNNWNIDLEKFFSSDTNYLYYEVDDDYATSENEGVVYRALSYGKSFSKELTSLFSNA